LLESIFRHRRSYKPDHSDDRDPDPARFAPDSTLEGSGFELPVPREKHGPTAPAIITLARRLEGLGGEFGTGQLSGRAGRRATWMQRQLSAAILLLIRGNPSSISFVEPDCR
jgi:hypothetical protein